MAPLEINPDPKTAYADYVSGDTDSYHPMSFGEKAAALIEFFGYSEERAAEVVEYVNAKEVNDGDDGNP